MNRSGYTRKGLIKRLEVSKTITESGMQFISNNIFHIEKSLQYTKLGDSVKMVEFVRTMGDKLLFVEAKSSFPNPHNLEPNEAKGNKTGEEIFREEVADICDKFTHALNLYSAIHVGATKDGFPADYKPALKVSLMFILVIRGFERSWCDEIVMAVKEKVRKSVSIAKIWKPEILVMNDEIAANRNIIVKSILENHFLPVAVETEKTSQNFMRNRKTEKRG
jgi:hypothetical protein